MQPGGLPKILVEILYIWLFDWLKTLLLAHNIK